MQLICGMHRSGTSLVARLAMQMGADFGDPAGFHPADEWNPDGYYEQADVLAVNLRLVNGPFGRLSYAWLPGTATLQRRSQPMAGEIQKLADKYASLTLKENRFCLTLPAWQAHGLALSRLLVVFRHPLAVCRSLRRRNRLPVWLGLRLWQQHYLRLVEQLQSVPSVQLLDYDALVSAGQVRTSLARIQAFTQGGASGAPPPDSDALGIRTRDHHAADTEPTPARVTALYQALRQLSHEPPMAAGEFRTRLMAAAFPEP